MDKRGLRRVGLVLAGSLTILGSPAVGSPAATATSSPRKSAIESCSSVRLVHPTSYIPGCGNGMHVLTAMK